MIGKIKKKHYQDMYFYILYGDSRIISFLSVMQFAIR